MTALIQCIAFQETEDLDLDRSTAREGVKTLLSDPTKGTYFVLEVQSRQYIILSFHQRIHP